MEQVDSIVSKVAFGPFLNFQPLRRTIFDVSRACSFTYSNYYSYWTNAKYKASNPYWSNGPQLILQERWSGTAGAYAAIKAQSRRELHSGASKLGAATPERTALRRIKQKIWALEVIKAFKDG